jgi:hypothetical protein
VHNRIEQTAPGASVCLQEQAADGVCVGGWGRLTTAVRAAREQAQKEGAGFLFLVRFVLVVEVDSGFSKASLLLLVTCRDLGAHFGVLRTKGYRTNSKALTTHSATPTNQL